MAVGERLATEARVAPAVRRGATDGARIRVAIAGATGYAGGELVRLLARHPNVEIVGLSGRDRADEPVATIHPHLGATDLTVGSELPPADAVFLAMPHGAAAKLLPEIVASGAAVIDLGPDFRLHDPRAYPGWYGFEHPTPELLATAVYGLPELHRSELMALRTRGTAIVASPGCYPTAALLAIAPLARAGLIEDVVIDAKSGVSGAGREAKPEMMFSEANESVRAYGLDGHRHLPEIEQEVAEAARGRGARDARSAQHAADVTFLPHLLPMTRGILCSAYVRSVRRVEQRELEALYGDAYDAEPFVRMVGAPPATKHVTGSNFCHVHVRAHEERSRVTALAVIDNLVKGAAGQAIQAFNLVHGLPETAGLEQLPLAP